MIWLAAVIFAMKQLQTHWILIVLYVPNRKSHPVSTVKNLQSLAAAFEPVLELDGISLFFQILAYRNKLVLETGWLAQ